MLESAMLTRSIFTKQSGGLAILFFVVLLLPWWLTSTFYQALLTQIGIAVIACLSYNILLGQGGMLSFGHAVYSGLGAYVSMHALIAVNVGSWSLPVPLIPLVGGLCGMAFAMLLGYVTTRRSGTTFAMITLGMSELVFAMALMLSDFFGGEAGLSGNRVSGPAWTGFRLSSQIQVYYLVAAYALGCTFLMYRFTQTPLGRLLNAVRDNAERVAFIGYNPATIRYLAFVVSGFFAGVSGGLAVVHFEIVTAEVVGSARSGAYLLFTYLGGTGVFWGPVLGAIGMVVSQVLLSDWTQAWLLYLGLLFLLMVVYAPGGLASLLIGHLQYWRLAAWRQLLGAYAALLVTGVLTFLGGALLIEMLYHWQLRASTGKVLAFAFLRLDVSQPISWVGATMTLLTGWGLFEVVRRLFVGQWESLSFEPNASIGKASR